ncbi:SCO family protein [Pontibacter sp. 172403-2]|uniref:SCO family protein n=1 Tax=Pontibacter rufus TaxID=2791028 RepID=UPI0018AF5F53|nr:SCO family protein [Pontibacter sp. 172403-2]MBF9254135.1 SCO family protein [Pontibacter sp. 172403-2]
MKRFTYFLFLALTLSFTACEQAGHSCCVKPTAAAAGKTTATTVANTTGALTDLSLYNLASDWTNQDKQPIKLEKLRGKVQLVAMIYTSCGYACPRTIADLQVLEHALRKYKPEELGITLVTLDPTRDTPARLKAFAAAHHLDARRWTLLTSQPDNIQELAALLNVKYTNDFEGNISHSNVITVLNTAGEIIYQQEGLGTNPAETVKAVEQLQQAM